MAEFGKPTPLPFEFYIRKFCYKLQVPAMEIDCEMRHLVSRAKAQRSDHLLLRDSF